MADGTRNKQMSKDVFKWIKRKSQPNQPNLIRNSNGDIVVEPTAALDHINDKWDDIFSANILHQEPEKILQFLWPHISELRCQAEIPKLTG